MARPIIMVIEPEVLIRMMIAGFLRDCGYEVLEAVSAGDLWIAIEAGVRPDIVFCELHLAGGTDGFALARTLRQTHPQIAVILTGAEGIAGTPSDLWETELIRKPYEAADVAARMKALLERRSAGSP